MDEKRTEIFEEIKFIKSKVKIPDEKFMGSPSDPGFYNKFDTVSQIVKTKEWKEVYSQFYEFDKFEMDISCQQEGTEDYAPERQLQEFVKCANSFPYFCHKYVKIFHPIDGLIPCVLYKYQRKVIEQYENNRFCIISKFRQGGLTTIAVLWSLWRCMFRTDQQIMVLSKTDREAMSAGEVAKRALENLPRWLKPDMDGENKHEKIFKDTGSALKFYTPEAARGKSLTILIIDEAAFIPDMETHWKAMYPVIATGGACYVISTVNGLGNWYEEQYHGAQADPPRNRFRVIDLEYWEHPDYCRPEWIAETKTNLGEKAWAQEVLRSFLGSGDTFIPAHIINELMEETRERMPKRILMPNWANRGEAKYGWEPGALWVWEEPHEGHEYIIGADCAEGMKDTGDNSCFQVLDMKTLEQVAEFYSNNIEPNKFAMVLQRVGIMYNHALIVVETNGVGSAVADALHLGLGYDNLHFENKDRKPGVKMKPTNRSIYLEAIQNKLLNGTLTINSCRFVEELKTFIYNHKSKRAEALRGKHDDAIMAMSITLSVRDHMLHNMPVGVEIPEETTQIFKADVYDQIKQEVLRGIEAEVLLEEDEERDSFFNFFGTEREGEESEAMQFRRRNDALLKEFGW